MKSDIPALMQERNLDALLVFGDAFHNPAMVYFTGIVHVTDGLLVIKRGQDPILFFQSMERDEAAKSNLETRSLAPFDFKKLFEESGQNATVAKANLFRLALLDADLNAGRVAVYGQRDSGAALALMDQLRKLLPQIEFIGEYSDTLLISARSTKDEHEIAQMRDVGHRTLKVVSKVSDFLSSQKEKDGLLVDENQQPITVSQVKSKIFLWLAEQGLDNPHGTIFSPGAEGGVPHSLGSPDALLRIGELIIFDIFPVQAGGGYYFDFTRTWCLGHAPSEVQALYDDVLHVYQTIMKELQVDTLCSHFQDRTCELFAEMGHPTVAEDSQTEIGYVHGLAHGLGLDIHEAPRFSREATDKDILRAGAVVTIEPGLYYPQKGMGCRLEDAVVALPNGKFEILAPYPLDLVLPLKS